MKLYLKQIIKEEIYKILNESDDQQKPTSSSEKKSSSVSYSALVLYRDGHETLVSLFGDLIPQDWEIIAHHATINLGKFKGNRDLLNKDYDLIVDGYAKDDMVIAVKVFLPQEIIGKENPHITIAINRNAGAKPAASNKLNWNEIQPIGPLSLKVKFVEVMLGDNEKFADEY